MTRSLWLACIALCGATAGLTLLSRAGRAQLPLPPRASHRLDVPKRHVGATKLESPRRQAEEAIRKALRRPVTVDFHETPLEDVAAFVRDRCRIPVLLDLKAMKDVGLKRDTPVSLRVSSITLRSALRLMLRDLALAHVVRDEVLMITTPEEAECHEVTRVYPVADLAGSRTITGELAYDFDSLIESITCCVRPESWGDGTGPGPVSSVDFGGTAALVFRQTEEIHQEISSLLEALRSVARQTAKGKTPDPILFVHEWPEPPAYGFVRNALSKNVSVDFRETPLEDAIDHLREVTEVNIILDRRALGDVNVPENAAVSIQMTDATLRSALREMLRGLDLTYQVWDEVLTVTTPEEAEMRLTFGIYPIADLIAPPCERGFVGYIHDIISDLITGHVEPTRWGVAGGPGSVLRVDLENLDVLVIAQRQDVHEQVAAYLARFRDIVEQVRKDPGSDPIERLRRLFDEASLHEPAPATLAKKVDFDFDRTPLVHVAKFIGATCGIPCRLDERAVEDVGLNPDAEVTLRVSGITLRSGLELVLAQLDLTWIVQGGTLLITTPERAEEHMTYDVYSVGDLVTFRDENGDLWEDYRSLVETITCNVRAHTWHVSGRGQIAAGMLGGEKILMARQTDRAHEEIAELLQELRGLARQASDDGQPPRRNRFYGGWGRGFF